MMTRQKLWHNIKHYTNTTQNYLKKVNTMSQNSKPTENELAESSHDHLADLGLSFDDIVAFWQAFAAREDDYTKNHNPNWTRD
jgi:uncharacterized protein YjiS (DUF1127 family)